MLPVVHTIWQRHAVTVDDLDKLTAAIDGWRTHFLTHLVLSSPSRCRFDNFHKLTHAVFSMKTRYYSGTDLLYICFTFKFCSIIIINKWSNQCILIEINVCFVTVDRKTLTLYIIFLHFFNENPILYRHGSVIYMFTFKFCSIIFFNKWSNQCIVIEINVCFVTFDRKT